MFIFIVNKIVVIWCVYEGVFSEWYLYVGSIIL